MWSFPAAEQKQHPTRMDMGTDFDHHQQYNLPDFAAFSQSPAPPFQQYGRQHAPSQSFGLPDFSRYQTPTPPTAPVSAPSWAPPQFSVAAPQFPAAPQFSALAAPQFSAATFQFLAAPQFSTPAAPPQHAFPYQQPSQQHQMAALQSTFALLPSYSQPQITQWMQPSYGQQPYGQQQGYSQPNAVLSGSAAEELQAMFGQSYHRATAGSSSTGSSNGRGGGRGRRKKTPISDLVHAPQFLDVEPTDPTPFGFCLMKGRAFKPHQLFIIQWLIVILSKPHLSEITGQLMSSVLGVLLVAEMGLGKTLMTQAYIQWRRQQPVERDRWPALIIGPKNLAKSGWQDSSREFFGNALKMMIWHDQFTEPGFSQSVDLYTVLQYDCVYLSYDSMLIAAKNHCSTEIGKKGRAFHQLPAFQCHSDANDMKGLQLLLHIPWSLIVCDESQTFASGKNLTKALLCLNGYPRICLSGTPIRNKATDMFHQMRFLGFDGIDSERQWSLDVYNKFELSTRCLVMDYALANIQLPPLTEYKLMITLSETERQHYNGLLELNRAAITQMEHGLGGVTWDSILVLLTRLRQSCVAPFLVTDKAKQLQKIPDSSPPWNDEPGMDWLETVHSSAGIMSAKISKAKAIAEEVLIPQKRKCLVFSNWRSVLLLIKWALDPSYARAGCYCAIVDGQMSGQRFEEVLDNFRYDPRCLVLLTTFKKGGAGRVLL